MPGDVDFCPSRGSSNPIFPHEKPITKLLQLAK